MYSELTYTQIQELKSKIKSGVFDAELEVNKLIILGFESAKAKELVLKVMKSYKDDLFDDAKEKKELEERSNVAFLFAVMPSIFIALFGGNNGLLILISIVVACCAGYYGYPQKPIAAMIGFSVGAIIMPFACGFYFRDRSSFINLELLIPILFSFGPGLLIKYALSRMLYSDED